MTLINIYKVLAVLGIGSMMLPILVFIFTKFKIYSIETKIFLSLSIFYFLFSVISIYLILSNNKSQDLFYLIFEIIEAFILLYLFVIKGKYNTRRLLIFLVLSILICTTLEYFFIHDYFSFNELTTLSLKLIVVTISFLYFKDHYLLEQNYHVSNRSFLWYNSILIIYFSTTFIISCFESIIRSVEDEIFLSIWIIYQLLGILYYSIISLNIWNQKR
jgi:hypothetical protein